MPNGVTFTAVSAGFTSSLAVDSNGLAWGWGYNGYGELGNGSTTNSSVPVAVSMPSGVTFVAISEGGAYSLALDSNGHAWGWGANFYGQLGNGSTGESSVPVQVMMPNGVTFTAVSAASDGNTSLAVDSTGRAWAWGDNTSGQLGDGKTTGSRLGRRLLQ
jgi:alpha-tubulin suppressor-like RCC1 family protein